MSTSAAETLEWLFHPASPDSGPNSGPGSGIDRKALAGLLVELARSVEPKYAQPAGVSPLDPRLEELRRLLVGHEIEVLRRLREVVEDPEQLGAAVGRVLPTAVASSDERLGDVLAPALEKATASSIRNDPRALVDILHPVIVPAIRKSVGETIDNTFQSLNESLRQSLSWRGLRWRFEAWRTGKPFAEVVLNHTLVYQVEHVFLIHSHTGLLISHVAAEDAASQDPQLVSSMLTAIQDFVKDSFQGAGQQGVDTLRLGDLRLWCEAGTFAMLVAVIRGNPPEELRGKLRDVLARIHEERRHTLETFDGDSSGLPDIEAHLAQCAALRQEGKRAIRAGFPWYVFLLAALIVGIAGGAGLWRWDLAQKAAQEQARIAEEQARIRAAEAERRAAELRRWSDYVDQLRAQPGIVVTESAERDGKFVVGGLRDPLAADPMAILRQSGIDPARVTSRWQPYQALEPAFVLQRLEASLAPPPSVKLSISGDHIVAQGSATPVWLGRARRAARAMPAGGPQLDISRVEDIAEGLLGKLRDSIQAHEIRFNTNESLPAPGQDEELDQLAAGINELTGLAASLHMMARIRLTGHSDDTGPGTYNLSLSIARAGAVLALLKKRGVAADLITIGGAGQLDPLNLGNTDNARSMNRRVSVAVRLEEEP
ncbi:OmpA family protein [Reyranella sp.]|uniref:OmpA family protein n=1 Tax=Reyranella sp. TaxID=1929291 RepID=UPI002F93871B